MLIIIFVTRYKQYTLSIYYHNDSHESYSMQQFNRQQTHGILLSPAPGYLRHPGTNYNPEMQRAAPKETSEGHGQILKRWRYTTACTNQSIWQRAVTYSIQRIACIDRTDEARQASKPMQRDRGINSRDYTKDVVNLSFITQMSTPTASCHWANIGQKR